MYYKENGEEILMQLWRMRRLFADLGELIQNCFFPNAAAKNLKPLG